MIEEGENQQLDFKFEITDSRKIAKSLVAFANTDGGTLLIGVKDNGAIAGIRSDEEIHMVEAAANMYCRPEIELKIKEWEIDQKTILEVKVAGRKETNHFAEVSTGKWLAYIRVNDQNLLANNVILKVRKGKIRKKGVKVSFTEAENILLDYLRKNDCISLSGFSKIADISRYRAENILVNFILLDIIKIAITEKFICYKLSDNND